MGSQDDIGRMLESKKTMIKRACIEATKPHKPSKKLFFVEDNGSEVIFSFRGFWDENDWYREGPFGETNINSELFPSLRRIGVNEPAKVNQAFQEKFQSMLELNEEFRKKVNAVKDKKQIVFTGHSSGGPIAVLATIWLLEKSAKSTAQIPSPPPPICITFGSPLVGCHIFSHALRREKWARHFVHVITRHDIIPRLFLAPFKCVEPHLARAFEFVSQKPNMKLSSPPLDVDKLFFDVLSSALAVTSRAACKLMESTNLLLETVSGFVELSPYRPFGTYVFLDDDKDAVKLVWLDNSEATLQLLFYSIQPESEEDARAFARKGLEDHSRYKTALERIENWNFYSRSGSNDEKLTGVLIDASEKFELCPRGRRCLRAAGESEKQKTRNLGKADSKMAEIETALKAVEQYKRRCEQQGVGYFDSFRLMKSDEDFKANVKRLELAGMWDEIIEMLKSYRLPDQFEGSEEWIELGTRFRRLVEPLDVANYYRHLKNEDTGPYMAGARPSRYWATQRWLEHFLRAKEGSCRGSCFWAELEELSSSLKSGAPDFAEKALKLRSDVLQWNENQVLERDILLKKIDELVHGRRV